MRELAKRYVVARDEFYAAVLSKVRSSPTMTPKSAFWEMLEGLIDEVKRNAGRDDPVSHGVREFVRKTDDPEVFPQFLATYSRLKGKLTERLKDGDFDDLSQLVDSIPLCGKDLCLSIINGLDVDIPPGFSSECVESRLEEEYVELMAGILSGISNHQ